MGKSDSAPEGRLPVPAGNPFHDLAASGSCSRPRWARSRIVSLSRICRLPTRHTRSRRRPGGPRAIVGCGRWTGRPAIPRAEAQPERVLSSVLPKTSRQSAANTEYRWDSPTNAHHASHGARAAPLAPPYERSITHDMADKPRSAVAYANFRNLTRGEQRMPTRRFNRAGLSGSCRRCRSCRP
jgi:hypothetical protein